MILLQAARVPQSKARLAWTTGDASIPEKSWHVSLPIFGLSDEGRNRPLAVRSVFP
jgi:hypothetical protein